MNWIKRLVGLSRSGTAAELARDPDYAPPASAKSKGLAQDLPRITQKHLHREFGEEDYTEQEDDLGPSVEDGIGYWNDEEYAEAYAVFKEAIDCGPNDYDRSCLDCLLGQLEVMKNDLNAAVYHFTQCLANQSRADDYAWQAAKRLSYIYEAVGNLEAAQDLADLADYINDECLDQPVGHTVSVRADHQDLVWRVMRWQR
ncbi:MAG: hypothetical protein GY835_25595 [bacterium]|nr:hypothetical protein [bacterium]